MSFVFVFLFFVLSMYAAIIIRNFNSVKKKRMLISEGMAQMLYLDWLSNVKKWINLILLRPPNLGHQTSQEQHHSSPIEILNYNWA